MSDVKNTIISGKSVLGIEFGSTRIKAVLVDENNTPIASGAHDWENRLRTGSGPVRWRISGQGFRTAIRR